MPPIPIHTNSPIKPTPTTGLAPDGSTPQTLDSNPQPTRTTPAYTPATPTASTTSNPPPPQPGARPIAPTPNAYQPTPTGSNNPPPPQPGAGPGNGNGGRGGYTATHITSETRVYAPPPQMSIPPPTDTQLAGRSTTSSTTASKPGPTMLNLGPAAPAPSPYQGEHTGGAVGGGGERQSLEHPPGYVQAPDHLPGSNFATGGGGNSTGTGSSGEGGVGEAAWNMLSKAGEALKKGEEAAWRAISKP